MKAKIKKSKLKLPASSFVERDIVTVFHDVNESRHIEESLKASEQRMNKSQEIAHLGSWELDVVNNRLFWSDEVYRIFGLKPKEFEATYDAFLEAVHPDDRAAVDAVYSNSLREGKTSYEIEHRIVRKSDKAIRIVHEKCEHVRDESGKIIRSVGMVHDITERKQLDEKIKHLASFPQLNPNPIIELNLKGRIIFSNLAAIKTLKKLKVDKQIKLFLPKDITQIIRKLNFKKGKAVIREVEIKDRFFIETVLAAPELQVVRVYAHDITNLKLAENKLKKIHEGLETEIAQRTRELVDTNKQLTQQIFERQLVEKRIRISNSILKLFGKTSSRKEYLDKLVKLLKSLSRCRCVGIRILDETGNIPYNAYIGFSEEFWKEENCLSVNSDQCACTRVMTAKLLLEDQGAMTSAGSFYLNNSLKFMDHLKKKERDKFRGACLRNKFLSIAIIPMHYKGKVRALIHLADEKEKKLPLSMVESIESVTELIGEGIYKFTLLKKIQESNELEERTKRLSDIGSLAATVAHELRNPLSVIRTAAYNIKRKANHPLLESHLANIEKKVLEADQIINNLLFYSRLKTPHIETMRLFDVIKECIENTKGRHAKSNISVNEKMDLIKNHFIEADPLQMGELFNNLLNNAYDAFTEDEGKIEISALEDNLNNIVVKIKDCGDGMDAEQVNRIFEPFYTTKAKGTGLGLSVCKQIINLHNGNIGVESRKNEGTTVTVTLPLRRNGVSANLDS